MLLLCEAPVYVKTLSIPVLLYLAEFFQPHRTIYKNFQVVQFSSVDT